MLSQDTYVLYYAYNIHYIKFQFSEHMKDHFRQGQAHCGINTKVTQVNRPSRMYSKLGET